MLISDCGSTKNEMGQQLIQDTLLRPSINFNDVENMIAAFESSSSRNKEKWIDCFEKITALLNLSDLHFGKTIPNWQRELTDPKHKIHS